MTSEEIVAQAEKEIPKGLLKAITEIRWNVKGWEPTHPYNKSVTTLVEKGLVRRADGICGFERMKDAFIIPTAAGNALRKALLEVKAKQTPA